MFIHGKIVNLTPLHKLFMMNPVVELDKQIFPEIRLYQYYANVHHSSYSKV